MAETTAEEAFEDETVREAYELLRELSPAETRAVLSKIDPGEDGEVQILPYPPVNAIGGWATGRKQVPDPDREEDEWPVQWPSPLPVPLPGGPGPTFPEPDDILPGRPETRGAHRSGRRSVSLRLTTDSSELDSGDGIAVRDLDVIVNTPEDEDDFARTYHAASTGRNAVVGAIEGALGVDVSDGDFGDGGGGDIQTDVTIEADEVTVDVNVEMN